MYVWFDALSNYISTLGWPEDTNGDFKKYWEGGTPTQYCGKDNTRFQAVVWQAMLMAAEIPNSNQIVVNGFIMGGGGVKMSKTLGNVVDPKEMVAEYGTDALRLYLFKEVSNFEDSPFTKERFKECYNSNLANGIGNLLSRTLTMATNMGGEVTKHDSVVLSYEVHGFNLVEKIETFSIEKYINDAVIPRYTESFSKYEISTALESVYELISLLDRTIARTEPFKLIKTDKPQAEAILYDILSASPSFASASVPFAPRRELIGRFEAIVFSRTVLIRR
jgi:methionyl-tRNA synthetase